ncbi:SGNH/GDSL hydrolase family protein [Asticcacaulis sp. AND118]|uniref:SGNH/GDSL hydrolase family protein n=1 Tax=Asticcacaulis sp. AND118 TaxID=2840468 RepID=UPI001CFF9EDA|nr:SGNH/GDSL hydrolase family protein [Asticcacaulis sp. AND118]UDF04527.1 SGNH/GDSL hydrolase family protein [Asticcacaulis sp. AND118]
MSVLNRRALMSGLTSLSLLPALPAFARTAQHWTPSWYAAPEPSGNKAQIEDLTLRQIVRLSAGGSAVRIRLSNAYGDTPLRIDELRVAKRVDGARIDPQSDRAATFNGQTGVTIPPGAYVLSDPIALTVEAHADLALSLYVKGPAALTTLHEIQRGALYVTGGRETAAAELPVARTDIGIGNAFPWMSGVEVVTARTQALVAFGDSITDGFGITPDQGKPWPDQFSERLSAANIPLSVVNAGISGNRLLNHGTWARFGTGALARFDRDVLAQPNVAAVVLLIGINDLGHAAGPDSAGYAPLEALKMGLTQIAARAQAHGIRVYAATLTPFKGTTFKDYYADEKETRRVALNAWIRQSDVFDGVFDFDKALDDPARPGWLLKAYDVKDGLHPNDAGAAKMAQSIPLDAFNWARKS